MFMVLLLWISGCVNGTKLFLQYSDYRLLLEEHPDVFDYQQTLNDEMLIVVTNFSAQEQTVVLDAAFKAASGD